MLSLKLIPGLHSFHSFNYDSNLHILNLKPFIRNMEFCRVNVINNSILILDNSAFIVHDGVIVYYQLTPYRQKLMIADALSLLYLSFIFFSFFFIQSLQDYIIQLLPSQENKVRFVGILSASSSILHSSIEDS